MSVLKLPEVTVWNRQRGGKLDLDRMYDLSNRAVAPCLEKPGQHAPVLLQLPEVEVSLVSDRVIAQVHRQFMAVPGPTDVITFEHGEVVVSVTTAAREGARQNEPVEREVLRYIVHGLLHLNGHEDVDSEEAAAMWQAQETIIQQLWSR